MSAGFTWLTPPAPAAIAVVQVPVLPELLDRQWPEPGRARFARLRDPAGRIIDEVLADRVDGTTGWLMPHGGPGVRQAVTAALTAHGLRAAATAQDPTWSALAAAAHPAAVAWLVAHPDTPPPFPRELLFRQPVVLITGPANAGKSTLLNAWCGHARALVSDQAGTTRDLVTASALVAGWRLRLTDSAGLRATDDPLERAGQDLVAWARTRADAVLHLCPPGGETTPAPDEVRVAAKADVAPGDGLPWARDGLPGRPAAALLEDLGRAVLHRLGLPPG